MKEALKLALEALEEIALAGMSGTGQESKEAMTEWHARQAWNFIGIAARQITAIKEALAQPEQIPPSAYSNTHHPEQEPDDLTIAYMAGFSRGKDSAPQRTWVGLTEEDKQIAFDSTQEGGGFWEFADAIEAKLKEKNGC